MMVAEVGVVHIWEVGENVGRKDIFVEVVLERKDELGVGSMDGS